jgi:hypothetical protein
MSKLKNSLITLVGLLALIGAVSIATPFKGYGQNSPETVETTTNVQVVNPATAPVPTLDAPTQVLQRQITADFGSSSATILDKPIYTVPAGKKLVIESVTVSGALHQDEKLVSAFFTTTVNNFKVNYSIPVQHQKITFSGQTEASALASVRLYATSGTTVTVSAIRSDISGSSSVTFGFSGYLVNAPN